MMRLARVFGGVVFGMLFPVMCFANEAAAVVQTKSVSDLLPLAAGLCIAIAAFGGAFAQGRIASSFMEGISRNPGAANILKTPLILSLVFVETLVLFSFVIAIMLQGKL